jgi:hypothetical protein
MIVYKSWHIRKVNRLGESGITYCQGWFLFGLIPLYLSKDER